MPTDALAGPPRGLVAKLATDPATMKGPESQESQALNAQGLMVLLNENTLPHRLPPIAGWAGLGLSPPFTAACGNACGWAKTVRPGWAALG